jgi:hypothetical protein
MLAKLIVDRLLVVTGSQFITGLLLPFVSWDQLTGGFRLQVSGSTFKVLSSLFQRAWFLGY